MYKRKRAGNTITRKINSTKDTAAKADKNHYISNSYLEGFIPIDTEYFTASFLEQYCLFSLHIRLRILITVDDNRIICLSYLNFFSCSDSFFGQNKW